MAYFYKSYLGIRDLETSIQEVTSQRRIVFSIENNIPKVYYPNKTIDSISITETYPIYAQLCFSARSISGANSNTRRQ